ncbi:hypothetical protein CDAR_609091 [Caerostris darwini]|uniref:Uncharacterized protein n=1 Tax=Caerostris darwini TaxID=1538125 RepID=A0AAV4WM58_9ARAC|nr:hypothetical protein CDAR_609091 [Caerostris darwini]
MPMPMKDETVVYGIERVTLSYCDDRDNILIGFLFIWLCGKVVERIQNIFPTPLAHRRVTSRDPQGVKSTPPTPDSENPWILRRCTLVLACTVIEAS